MHGSDEAKGRVGGIDRGWLLKLMKLYMYVYSKYFMSFSSSAVYLYMYIEVGIMHLHVIHTLPYPNTDIHIHNSGDIYSILCM